jgi:hypothetical protein
VRPRRKPVGGKTKETHVLDLRKCERIKIIRATVLGRESGSKKTGGKTTRPLPELTKDVEWDQGASVRRPESKCTRNKTIATTNRT